jgi:protein tyrosine phosphatase (PTP) superfamily phosphohydrolase (DUF442 family)
VVEEIYNFLALSSDLICSGMPLPGELADVAAARVQLVVNLAPFDPAQDAHDEAAMVRSLGMEYASIPVDWEAPTTDDLRAFLKVMDENAGKKVLVHCRANYRATAFIALYRVLRQGWEPREALQAVRRIWDPKEYPVWDKFIAEHMLVDPVL